MIDPFSTRTGPRRSGAERGQETSLWEFFGDFEGGIYNGEHWEIFGDDRSLTGTLTLNR